MAYSSFGQDACNAAHVPVLQHGAFYAGDRPGKESFWLAVIRQLIFNIPLLFLLNRLFGMTGIVWTQATADLMTVIVSYY